MLRTARVNEAAKRLANTARAEDGYGTVEFMIIFAASAVIAGAVLSSLLPSIRNLHQAMSNNIRDISGSGY